MVRLLALTNALLATAIAAEVLVPAGETTPAMTAVAYRPLATSALPAPTEASRHAWLPAVLARPLFAPDRRPATGTIATDPGLPRLSGIISTPTGTVAIFQSATDGKPVLARSGDQIAGWQVAAVEPDAVTLRKAGARMVLHPRFSAAAQVSPQLAHPPLPVRR